MKKPGHKKKVKESRKTRIEKRTIKDLDLFEAEAVEVKGGAAPPDPCKYSRGC